MSDLFEAADVLRRHVKNLEAMQAAADVLERLGSLDQAEREAKARTADAKATLEAVNREVEGAKNRLAAVDAQGAKILADARREAEKALAESSQRSLERASAAEGKVTEAGAEVVAAMAKVDEAKADERAVRERIAQLLAEAEAVEDRVAKARAAAAALLR